jgi:uncharacterized protein YeeX (DUF496 family)
MGCTNIGDFFDTRGMFIVNSLEEIENVCSSLTPQTYEDMKPYVEKNYELSQSHAQFRERLKETVINYVNNL